MIKGHSRGALVANIALGGVVALLAVALIVNSRADIRDSKRMATDRRVLDSYLDAYGGGHQHYLQPYWIHVHRKVDLGCAWYGTSRGGICVQVVSVTTSSRTIVKTWRCVDLPKAPKHVKHWKPRPSPTGRPYCPAHARKVIV